MTTSAYLAGRKKYTRPQAMLWSNNPGRLENGLYIPNGLEINQNAELVIEDNDENEFLILSDDNRSPIDFSIKRIEQKMRMINGRMRSYHVADKLRISVSWNMLPSRSFAESPAFDTSGNPGISSGYGRPNASDNQFTTDGGAGGVDMLSWYETHQGPFWVYLAYDKHNNFAGDPSEYSKLVQYNQVLEMYFEDFAYTVEKRGGSNYDMWNVSVVLEEV